MTEENFPQPAERTLHQELLDLIPRLPLLPDEDVVAFEDLRQAFLRELAPTTAYQTALAENLACLEWEIHRHRSLLHGSLRGSYRTAGQKLWDKDRLGDYADGATVSPGAKAFAEGLLEPTSEHRETALAWLAARNIDPAEIGAKAYYEARGALELHERKLAELEKRRRHLREDYDKVKAARVRPIEEAKLLGDHDD